MSFAEITSCPSSRSIQSYNDLLLIKVDVVLVDKSPSHGPFSHVYQLPEQLFKPSVNLFELRHSLHEKRHNFIFLGESSHISKSAKKIFLCNGTIISYHYFIEIIPHLKNKHISFHRHIIFDPNRRSENGFINAMFSLIHF